MQVPALPQQSYVFQKLCQASPCGNNHGKLPPACGNKCIVHESIPLPVLRGIHNLSRETFTFGAQREKLQLVDIFSLGNELIELLLIDDLHSQSDGFVALGSASLSAD